MKIFTFVEYKGISAIIALLPQITTAPEGMLVEQLVRSGRNPYVSIFKELSDADLAAVEQAMKMHRCMEISVSSHRGTIRR